MTQSTVSAFGYGVKPLRYKIYHVR